MARRPHRSQLLPGDEPITSSPVSLAGLIKLQPNRKKQSNKVWRPLQLSDFGDDEGQDDSSGAEETDPHGDNQDHVFDNVPNNQHAAHHDHNRDAVAHSRAFTFNLPPLQTNFDVSPFPRQRNPSATYLKPLKSASDSFSSGQLGSASSGDAHTQIIEEYTKLFGKPLPDPIYLHVETGDFNGQIMFIGHPNRDVSAHQWSTSSYQWVNIGLYSHNRGRIEGSLGSDRLKFSVIPYNTIEYFKAVAEQREKAARMVSPSEAGKSPGSNQSANSMRSHQHTKALNMTPSGKSQSLLPQIGRAHEMSPAQSQGRRQFTPSSTFLEDPFVSTNENNHATTTLNNSNTSWPPTAARQDLSKLYPSQPRAQVFTQSDQPFTSGTGTQRQLFMDREQQRIQGMKLEGRTPEQYSERAVPNGQGPSTSGGVRTRQPYVPRSPEEAHERQELKNRLAALGDQDTFSKLPLSQRVAVPDVSGLERGSRGPAPTPGFTVANPHRVASTLNAQAAPYNAMVPYKQAEDDQDSDTTVVNNLSAGDLSMSDPDDMFIGQGHQIANGMEHQMPTPQNWNGPFFTDGVQQPEWQYKLTDWFNDGQRPARQQAYSRSIMAAAHENDMAAARMNVPAAARMDDPAAAHAGDMARKPWWANSTSEIPKHNYDNTPAFVRLYDNLSEYAEESRSGQGQSYFTRHWKPARPDQIDHGPNGNNSFFKEPTRTYHLVPQSLNSTQNYDGPSQSPYQSSRGFRNTSLDSGLGAWMNH